MTREEQREQMEREAAPVFGAWVPVVTELMRSIDQVWDRLYAADAAAGSRVLLDMLAGALAAASEQTAEGMGVTVAPSAARLLWYAQDTHARRVAAREAEAEAEAEEEA